MNRPASRTDIELTPDMIENGAAEMWRITHRVGQEVKPFEKVHPFVQEQLRGEAKLIWAAMVK